MPTKKRASKAVARPNPQPQTDVDSLGGAGAPTCESMSESGASPSNTAPDNSNHLPPDSFQLLRRCVDSLYLSIPGDLSPDSLRLLELLKQKAQNPNPLIQSQAQYQLGTHVFEVKDKGTGLFPFVLEDNAYRIQIARTTKNLPMAYVKVSAEYLAFLGPEAVLDELKSLLAELGELAGSNTVSRVDLAVDFMTSYRVHAWDTSSWVTRASKIDAHVSDQAFTGWSVGMGGHLACRLYDKVRECLHRGKDWPMKLWPTELWTPGQQVWRLEFEFKREFLGEMGLTSLQTVLDNLDGLWQYATTKWLRLCVPNEADSTRSRWPIHPLWSHLSAVSWDSINLEPLLRKFKTTRGPDERRMCAAVFGSLASYMAIHQIDDKHAALEGLIGQMHERMQTQAERDGSCFDELLQRKVAERSRKFNSGMNPDTPTSAPKDDDEDNPYRKASRGE